MRRRQGFLENNQRKGPSTVTSCGQSYLYGGKRRRTLGRGLRMGLWVILSARKAWCCWWSRGVKVVEALDFANEGRNPGVFLKALWAGGERPIHSPVGP